MSCRQTQVTSPTGRHRLHVLQADTGYISHRQTQVTFPAGRHRLYLLQADTGYMSCRQTQVTCPAGRHRLHVLQVDTGCMSCRQTQVTCPAGRRRLHVLQADTGSDTGTGGSLLTGQDKCNAQVLIPLVHKVVPARDQRLTVPTAACPLCLHEGCPEGNPAVYTLVQCIPLLTVVVAPLVHSAQTRVHTREPSYL